MLLLLQTRKILKTPARNYPLQSNSQTNAFFTLPHSRIFGLPRLRFFTYRGSVLTNSVIPSVRFWRDLRQKTQSRACPEQAKRVEGNLLFRMSMPRG
jgi:hypothetical protein